MNQLEHLKKEIAACRECQDRFGYTPHPMVWGNVDAKIMQISQAPSLSVHNTMRPFNDLSGKKLREDWYEISDEIFYNQDIFYIASLAHCYPGKANGGGDRLPPKCCYKKWLLKEMALVNNEIYVVIGSYAAKVLFPDKKFIDLVFNDQELNGKPAYILPHPSPLNRRWFKTYPEFEKERIVEIRKFIKNYLI